MTRKPASIPTTDTTQELPGVTPAPAPQTVGDAVVAPATVAQELAPKKDRYLSSSDVLGLLAKVLPKTAPNSQEFFVILDAMSSVRSAALKA